MNKKCERCGEEKQCMGGRSAHHSNWYCSRCDYPQDEIDRLRTELQQHQWRSIESAPRDGSPFWVAGKLADGSWAFGVGRWYGSIRAVAEKGMLTTGWTHWKPFCAPPEPDQ